MPKKKKNDGVNLGNYLKLKKIYNDFDYEAIISGKKRRFFSLFFVLTEN